jgi:DNA-binding transcriptional LysR family regulator
VELRQIRYFVAVAEELHFGRAAARLGIAQPALSEQIKALERDLQVRLLARSSRSVHLTGAGAAFLGKCVQILTDVRDASLLAQEAAGHAARKLALGAIYPATVAILPRFIERLGRRGGYPLVEVFNGDTETLVRRMERGSVNFAFVRPISLAHTLRYEEIGDEPYLLAVNRRSPLAGAQSVALADLSSEKIIVLWKEGLGATEQYFEALFRERGLQDRIAFRCNDTVSILSLVSAGIGVGFVPGWVRGLSDPSVVLRSVLEVNYRVGLGVAWRADDPAFHPEPLVHLARLAFQGSPLSPAT